MKKLLLSLGSVAAIVAPVAAVVACGSSDDSTGTYKSYNKTSFIALLKKNGFDSELTKQSSKFKEANVKLTVEKMAGDFFDAIAKEGKIEAAVFAGTVDAANGEFGHNPDDHIILIKGKATDAANGTVEQVGAPTGTAYDKDKVYTFETKYDLLGNGRVVDTGLKYWGIRNNEQKEASFAIWKTVNTSTSTKNISIAPIIKVNNHFGTTHGYGFGNAIKSLNKTGGILDIYNQQ